MGTYLSLHFSVRARALSSLIVRKCVRALSIPKTKNSKNFHRPDHQTDLLRYTASIVIPLVIAYGRLLDLKHWPRRRRAWTAFAMWLIPQIASFIWIGIEYRNFNNDKTVLDYGL